MKGVAVNKFVRALSVYWRILACMYMYNHSLKLCLLVPVTACTKMQEMVSAFIAGNRASSKIVGNSHVNFLPPPPNIVGVIDAKLGEEYPIAFYKLLISWFAKDGDIINPYCPQWGMGLLKDGDTVLEIGCRNEVGNGQNLSHQYFFV